MPAFFLRVVQLYLYTQIKLYLVGVHTAVPNQLRREEGQGKRFATPRHGADGETAVFIFKYLRLGRSQLEIVHSPILADFRLQPNGQKIGD